MNQKSSKCVLVGLYSMAMPFVKFSETTAPMHKAVATVKTLPPPASNRTPRASSRLAPSRT